MPNIYLELELPLDPPLTEHAELTRELNKKIGEWNKLIAANPKYKIRVEAARRFIKDGLPDTVALSTAAYQERVMQLKHAVAQQKLLGSIGEQGFKKLKELFPCFTEDTLAKESGYVPEELFQPPKMPPSLDANRFIPAIEMDTIMQDLLTVDGGKYKDLYQLLGVVPDDKRDTIYKKALEENEKNRRTTTKTPEVDAKNRLYGKAIQYFKDDYEQLDYDAALLRQKFEHLCKITLQHRAVKGFITTAIYNQSITDACQLGLKNDEAKWLVYEYFCIKLKCPHPVSIGNEQNLSGQKHWNIWEFIRKPDNVPYRPPQPFDESRSLTVDEEPTLLLESFRYKDVKEAVVPVTEENLSVLFKDRVFWQSLCLCVLPLGLTSIFSSASQAKWQDFLEQLGMLVVHTLCIIAAVVLIRRIILRKSESIKLPAAAFCFTAFIAVPLLLTGYNMFPELFKPLDSTSNVKIFLRELFQFAVWEELVKIFPVMVYFFYYQNKASLKAALLIGFLSTLGLTAAKITLPFLPSLVGTDNSILHRLQPAIILFQVKLTNNLLPCLSLIIANAVWTATFTYFISCCWVAKRDWLKILVVGFGLTVVSHGLYTSLCAVDLPGLAALLVGASFVLFYGYFAKIRLQIQQDLKKDINP